MKRDYTREDILEKLNQIHKINPLALIATDIIVGYLDESDQDFQDTYSFLEKSPIHKFHVFRFSARQNTVAFLQKKRLIEPTPLQKDYSSKNALRSQFEKVPKIPFKASGNNQPHTVYWGNEGWISKGRSSITKYRYL